LIEKIKNFLDKYNLKNKTVIIGFSGGYDSMCLTDILSKLREEYGLKIVAAHYNHNWRGETAKKEQEKCEQFCKDKNIEFYTETADDNIKKNETEARKLRYKFFERAVKKYNADAVFTAHNYNDNAETLLYRIAKGTGIVGLKGILEHRDMYYRPLLSVKRADIEQYCKDNNLTPNIDDSNEDNIHKRNLIRNEILPIFKEINSDILGALNNLAKVAGMECSIIEEYTDSIKSKIYDGDRIKTQKFIKLSKNMQFKIIYNLIYNSEFDYTFSMIERIVNFINKAIDDKKPSKYSLNRNTWLYADKNIIEIMKEQDKNEDIIPLTKEDSYVFGDKMFVIEKADTYKKTKDETSAYVDLSDYALNNLVIRTRRAGDVIQPLGFDGTMKLKKYLMSKNIPQHERENILLLCSDKEVLWVAGVGLSDKIKTKDNKPTHFIKIENR